METAAMKVDLDSGRSIRLSRLVQWRTNEGLLCGTPSAASNDETLARTLDEARKFSVEPGEPLLITPNRKAVPNGEWLPAVTCIAVFDSSELQRDGSEPYSSLTIVWLQDSFAMPIDARCLEAIRSVDWERLATDWCW